MFLTSFLVKIDICLFSFFVRHVLTMFDCFVYICSIEFYFIKSHHHRSVGIESRNGNITCCIKVRLDGRTVWVGYEFFLFFIRSELNVIPLHPIY